MFKEYPYRNLEDLNLDYLLQRMRHLEKIVAQFVSLESVTFADPIQWSITRQYAKNVVVLDLEGNAFISKQPVPAGVYLMNEDYWLEIFNFMDYVKSFDSNLTLHIEANTDRATAAYSEDDWLLWDDILYKVTAAIAFDDLLIVDTNIERFTVEDFCRAWATYMVNTIAQYKHDTDADIVQYKNDIDASELAYRNLLAGDIASTTASLQAQLDLAIAGATVDSEVINARLGADGVTYATLGDAIRTQFDHVLDILKYNLKVIELTNGAYIQTNGATTDISNPTSASGWNYAVVDCAEGDIISVAGVGSGSARLWAFIDSSENVLDAAPANTTYSTPTEITAPATAAKCIINTSSIVYSYMGVTTPKMLENLPKGVKNLNGDIIHDRDYIIVPQSNLYDKNTAIDGYYNNDGTFTVSSSYKTNSEKIKVAKGDQVAISAYCRISVFFDLYGNLVKFDTYGTATDTHILTAPADGYLYLCIYANYVDTFMAAAGSTVQSYAPYKKLLQNDIEFNTSQIAEIQSYVDPMKSGNILYGKKYVACGDSFTHGDFQYSQTNDYIFTDAPYAGEYKVYPFFIGRRNGMTIINEAQNGSTMTNTGDPTLSFSVSRYQNIPADADYITLNFGINDDSTHSDMPLGTRSDSTNTTFWGAWNVVMDYLIRNHPDAKIGIIVPNGAEDSYCEVVRQVAEYWGVPYLDIPKSPQVPLNIRCYDKVGTVNAAIMNFRNDHWYVNNNGGTLNLHPNELCHEYESTYIENWLRTL